MSVAQTWLARSILSSRSRYGSGGAAADSAPNTLAARSSNWLFQSLI